jgi:hypothetical protein
LSLAIILKGNKQKRMRRQEILSKKRIKSILFSVALVILIGINPNISAKNSSGDNSQEILKQILNKTGEYCERIKEIALYYVCKENIEVKENLYKTVKNINPVVNPYGELSYDNNARKLRFHRTKKKTLIYDYQLVKKEKNLEEKRVLIQENRKKKQKKNAELKTNYQAKYIIYGPVGFLSKYWQYYFDFEVTGEEIIENKKTRLLKASPKPSNKNNRNYATIWIDKNDFSILQIEWEPESIIDYQDKSKFKKLGDIKRTVTWRITYGIEKNGVRFPSKQFIQDGIIDSTGEKKILEEISFIYDNYKFFIVEIEYKT